MQRRWLHDLPIRRKLAIAILVASGVAVLVAALAVLLYETTTFRPRVLKEVATAAEILSLVMPAALDFNDARAATENLRTLSTMPEIQTACVYRPQGEVFTAYPDAEVACPDLRRGITAKFGRSALRYFRPIRRGEGLTAGYLYLEYRLPPLPARLPQYGIMSLVVLVALLSVSLLVQKAADRLIVKPIWELASTALRVTAAKDYSVRARVRSGDELGTMTEALNEMLDTIEENVTERRRAESNLRRHSQLLEERVEERTRELKVAQDKLIRQERLAFLGQLAGGVSHELRRPLATIGNAIYYLEMIHGDSDEKTRKHVEIIRNQINSMQKIIHDLLDSLRVEPKEVQKIRPGPWLRDVLERLAPPEGIAVQENIPEDLPAVWMDAEQMERVASNLVTNAYQAISGQDRERAIPGEVSVSASAEQGGISLCIRDNGPGIAAEHLESIFEPLFTTKARGIGLGLTISKNFVVAGGGRLTVESVEGEGSTFMMFLPTRPPSFQEKTYGSRNRGRNGKEP